MLRDNVLTELNNEFTLMFWRYHKENFLEELLELSSNLRKYDTKTHHLDFARKYELGGFKGFEQSYSKALGHYLEAARLGSAEANLKAALFYLYGYGVKKPDKKLFEEYLKVAIGKGSIAARRYFNVWNNSRGKIEGKTFFPMQR